MTDAEKLKMSKQIGAFLKKQTTHHKRIKAIKGFLGVAVFLLIILAAVFAVGALVSAIMAPRAVLVVSIWVMPFIIALGASPVIIAVTYLYGKIDEKIRNMYRQ